MSTDFAWLAALLRPRDVAPHPNYLRAEVVSSAGLLALLITARRHDYQVLTDSRSEPGRPGREAWEAEDELSAALLRAASTSLRMGTVREGADGLASVAKDALHDPGMRTAAALLASVAYAECDDYSACLTVVDSTLATVRAQGHPLHRAVLLLQRGLRLRDCGDGDGLDEAREADTLLGAAEVPHVDFPVSRSIEWTSAETVRLIYDGLCSAAISAAVDPGRPPTADAGEQRTWEDVIRRTPPLVGVQTTALRATSYQSLVADLFKGRTRGTTADEWRFGTGENDGSLFAAQLQDELYGRPFARTSRRLLGEFRTVRLRPEPEVGEVQDVLRLLRHSDDAAALKAAINWVSAGGPLAALSEDAAQILATRVQPLRIGRAELMILRRAAPLLDGDTARSAFRDLLPVVDRPQDARFGRWSARSSHLELAWPALTALAAAGRIEVEGASRLIEAAAREAEDQLSDRALRVAATEIDWLALPTTWQAKFRRTLQDDAWVHPGMADLILNQLPTQSAPVVSDEAELNLSTITDHVNATMNGTPFPAPLLVGSIEILSEALEAIILQAARGEFRMQVPNPADVALALGMYAGVHEVWAPIAQILSDPRVSRLSTTTAFDRLAGQPEAAPAFVVERLRRSYNAILFESHEFFGPDVTPYPAALRCFDALGIISQEQALWFIAELAGPNGPNGRLEAARTVSSGCRRDAPAPWLSAFAVQFSYDEVPEVRAEAGRALALLLRHETDRTNFIEDRLRALLNSDGYLIPTLTLRGLASINEPLGPVVTEMVGRIADTHPSRVLRESARRIRERSGVSSGNAVG